MLSFIRRYRQSVVGVLHGFDRLIFRGTLRNLMYAPVMKRYLDRTGLLLKDFGVHVRAVTQDIRQVVEADARAAGRPVLYLPSPQISKEDTARAIAARDGVSTGLIALLAAVEPCWSYQVVGSRARLLELQLQRRKCLHLYQYWMHPVFGFIHVRLQSWFPFTLQVYLNGREWLARQMDQAGLGYRRRDNCFVALADGEQAQHLLDAQQRVAWPALLNEVASWANPRHAAIFADFPQHYYWSVFQSEYATDVLFRDRAALARLYPGLVRHGITTFASPDVLRFLGHKAPTHGTLPSNFRGQVVSDVKTRPEGVRLKHRVNGNSIKVYDKQGSVLRVETTIQDPGDFKVYRRKEGDSDGALAWRPLRLGVADLHRRAGVSQAANARYLEALAAVEVPTTLAAVLDPLCRPAAWKGRRVRALNPFAPDDAALLQAIGRGEFLLNGFRNRDLQGLLYARPATTDVERRRRSAAVTRKLRLLRGHGLIQKVTGTHRYLLTDKGRSAVTVLPAARQADVTALTKPAA